MLTRISLPTRLAAPVALVALAGCATSADFQAVGALRAGQTQAEARGAIEAHGFKDPKDEVLRPAAGWPAQGKGFFDTAHRAGLAEQKLGTRIASAEAYPVHHGLLGYGWIYLFYDEAGKLASYYRLQIN